MFTIKRARRAAALACFLLAGVLAGAAVTSATTGGPGTLEATAPAPADGPLGAAGDLVLHVAATVQAFGFTVSEGLDAVRSVPGGDVRSPDVERAENVDLAAAGAPVNASLDARVAPRGSDPATTQSTAFAAPPADSRVMALSAASAGAAAAAVAAAGAVAWFWPSVKAFVTRVFVTPLYSHVTRAGVFKNAVRERVFGIIRDEPGVSASEIATRLGVSWGTTIFHLDVLEQNRCVVSEKHGRHRRYFEAGAVSPQRRGEVAALRNPVTASVAARVALAPGLTQKELARSSGLSPQALHWHAQRLLAAGVVRKERDGRVVRFFRA